MVAGANNLMFQTIREDLADLKEEQARHQGNFARAEVGAATPRYASIDDVPAFGILGRWASVEDDVPGGGGDAGLFWDSGLAWVQIV